MAGATEEIPDSSTAGVGAKLHRRIAFHLARRPCNGIPASSGDFFLETLNPDSSAGSKATLGDAKVEAVTKEKGSVDGEFYEHRLDPELSFRITFRKIGAGLANLGNTCYLNSVLQCLTYTEPFAAYLQSGKHKSTCRAAGFCAMCALQNHVMDALQSTGKILRPFQLVKNLRCISRNFSNSRQEDAHEYMVHLLESMHKCCLPCGIPSESPSAYEKSQVHKIFGGQLRSQVKCMQCSFCSNKFDPFLDLSLEIVKADSVSKALANFSAVELLDGGERQYHCQRCKEKVKALKQLTIHKAPNVLTIHLKRFGSSIHGEKISKKVEYGTALNLKPFISDPHGGEYKYELYGVLVHAGWTTRSGHYFCYVRTSAGMWYSLDDNQVTQVSEKTVLSREAYMLFYVRSNSFVIKNSVESVPKPNISALVGNKELSSIERRFMAVYSSAKTKPDNHHGEPILQMGSFIKPMAKDGSSLDRRKEHFPTKGSCSSTNGNHTEELQDLAKRSKDSKPPSSSEQVDRFMNKSAPGSHLLHWMQTDQPLARVCLEEEEEEEDLEQLCTTASSVIQEYSRDTVARNSLGTGSQAESKLKKIKKSSLAKGSFFGSKQLFFMSLYQQKKNLKGRKKRYLNYKNKIRKKMRYRSFTDSLEPSTSRTSQVDVGSERLSEKQRKEGAELGCISVHCEERNSINVAVPDASNRLCGQSCSRVEEKISENADTKICSVNLLMASLRKTTVARWDDKISMPNPMNEMENKPKRNIGYMVDEWDEEYDRGKTKKVKKCRQWWGGGGGGGGANPFQETANSKARQQLLSAAFGRCRSENQPFRI